LLTALALLVLAAPPALARDDLFRALHGGGYVLVMRHAHAPAEPPAAGKGDPENKAGERQLDDEGMDQARRVGRAMKALRIPIGPAYSSPAFRAVETARLMGFDKAQAQTELGDGGASMAASAAGKAGTAWLLAKAGEATPPGKDVLIVTHGPNIALALGLKDLGDGETAVLRPDGKGGFALAGRITPKDWNRRRAALSSGLF
jgi:phosphohistidine phosphatase SixA